MKLYKELLLLIIVLVSCLSFAGCKKEEEKIVLDDSYPLALSPSVDWAVVIEPYAAYKKEPRWDAEVVGHCKRGEILQIQGKAIDDNGEKWCSFQTGWLAESAVNIYENRYKAEYVSNLMLKDDENNK